MNTLFQNYLNDKLLKVNMLDINKFTTNYRTLKQTQLGEVYFEISINSDKTQWPLPTGTPNIFHYALVSYQNYFLLLEGNEHNFRAYFKAIKSHSLSELYNAIQEKTKAIDNYFEEENAFHLAQISKHLEKERLESLMPLTQKSNKTKLKL